MGRLTEQQKESLRRGPRTQAPQPVTDRGTGSDRPSLIRQGGAPLRWIDRAERIVGLGLGTAAGLVGEAIPGVKKWTPDVYSSGLDAFRAFTEQAGQGDWDAAIEAYQDELDAGPGFWGAAEAGGAVLSTVIPGMAGARIARAAPMVGRLAGRPAELATRGLGETLRAPLRAEEAITRGIGRGIGAAARPVVSRLGRIPGPAPSVTPEDAVISPPPPRRRGPRKKVEPSPEGDLAPNMQDMDEVTANVSNQGLVANFLRSRGANLLPGMRRIARSLNPAALASKPEAIGPVVRAMRLSQANQFVSRAMGSVAAIGRQQDLFGQLTSEGLIAASTKTHKKLHGLTVNTIRTEIKRYRRYLTPQQSAWVDAMRNVERAKLNLLIRNGLKINVLKFEDGGEYAGRRVYGKVNSQTGEIEAMGLSSKGPRGGKQPYEKERKFKDDKAAIDEGYRYLTDEEALQANLTGAYRRIANKDFMDWILNEQNTGGSGWKARLRRRGDKQAGLHEIRDIKPNPKGRDPVIVGKNATKVAEYINKTLADELQVAPGAGVITKINAIGRYMVLAGDASPFMIQMFFMAAYRPLTWGRAIGVFARTLFDTRYHARMLENNRSLLSEYPDVLTSLKGLEMAEAVETGGLLTSRRLLNPAGLAGRVLDPAARAFASSLDSAGINLLKSLDGIYRKKWEGLSEAQIAVHKSEISSFINEIRGLASSSRLGVSRTMQMNESALLLAPRYTRSAAALVHDILNPLTTGGGTGLGGGIRGREAKKAFGLSFGALLSITSAFAIAKHLEDDGEATFEDILETVIKKLSPANPEFVTWQVGDTLMGPGTKIRSLLNLFANVRKDIDEAATNPNLKWDEKLRKAANPALRFLRSNSSPAVSTGLDITGFNYIGDPTGLFDGWANFAEEEGLTETPEGMPRPGIGGQASRAFKEIIAPNIMPIWAQSVLLESDWTKDSLKDVARRGTGEFAGLRAYPIGRKQRQERIAQSLGYGEYEKLTARQKIVINDIDMDPDHELGYGVDYTGENGKLYAKKDNIRQIYLAELDEIENANGLKDKEILKKGSLASEFVDDGANWVPSSARASFIKARQEYRDALSIVNKDLYGDDPREEPERKDYDTDVEYQTEHDVWRYYQLYRDEEGKDIEFDDYSADDWERHNANEREFWTSLNGIGQRVKGVMDNIRAIEELYPPNVKNLVEAMRYASNVELSIAGGPPLSYWELIEHPQVMEFLETASGQSTDKVNEYLDMKPDRREAQARVNKDMAMIHAAFEKAKRSGGVLGTARQRFIMKAYDEVPEWLLAMRNAGYPYTGHKRVNEAIRAGTLEKIPTDPVDYNALLMGILVRR